MVSTGTQFSHGKDLAADYLRWTGSELQEHAEYQETLNVVARLLLQEGLCQEMEIEFPQWIEFVV